MELADEMVGPVSPLDLFLYIVSAFAGLAVGGMVAVMVYMAVMVMRHWINEWSSQP